MATDRYKSWQKISRAMKKRWREGRYAYRGLKIVEFNMAKAKRRIETYKWSSLTDVIAVSAGKGGGTRTKVTGNDVKLTMRKAYPKILDNYAYKVRLAVSPQILNAAKLVPGRDVLVLLDTVGYRHFKLEGLSESDREAASDTDIVCKLRLTNKTSGAGLLEFNLHLPPTEDELKVTELCAAIDIRDSEVIVKLTDAAQKVLTELARKKQSAVNVIQLQTHTLSKK